MAAEEEKKGLLKPDEKPKPEPDSERALRAAILHDEAYDAACRARMWAIGVPAFATLACVLCLYVCEDCLIGVMVFCAALCFRDWVLVLVFWTSLALLLIRHPMDPGTLHRASNAAFEFVRTEPANGQ
jgi:hypothetical protein